MLWAIEQRKTKVIQINNFLWWKGENFSPKENKKTDEIDQGGSRDKTNAQENEL